MDLVQICVQRQDLRGAVTLIWNSRDHFYFSLNTVFSYVIFQFLSTLCSFSIGQHQGKGGTVKYCFSVHSVVEERCSSQYFPSQTQGRILHACSCPWEGLWPGNFGTARNIMEDNFILIVSMFYTNSLCHPRCRILGW